MHLSSLLDIAADALGDRVAVAACAGGAAGAGGDLTYTDLSERTCRRGPTPGRRRRAHGWWRST